LIELLVTVAILGVIAAIALVASVDTVDSKAEVTSREIIGAIRYAKVYALSRREGHKVIFNTASNTVRVEDAAGNPAWNPITFSPYEWTLQYGDLASADFDGSNTLEFGTTGEGLSGGTVVVLYDGLTQTFTVSPITGRVAVGEVRN
jgi:Tfp pilus assembly protein FimT